MKLTTKGRYAVTAMLDLAIHQQKGPTTVMELAQRHGISPTYLERLTGLMRAKGLLKSVRGPRGGYVLGRSAEAITVADIIAAVEDEIDATRCGGKANCQEGMMCLTHHLWDALNQQVSQFLQGITLSDLAHKPQVLAVAQRQKPALQLIRLEQHA